MKKYHVVFVENSCSTVKSFAALKDAKAFKAQFLKDNPDPYDGYWVDFIVSGEFIYMDDSYKTNN